MQILRASIKVLAVLGIALLIVIFIAAILYALQKTNVSDTQDVARDADGESPSKAVGSSTVLRPEAAIPIPSEIAESRTPDSASESPIEASKSSVSKSEPPVSTDNAPEKPPLEGEQGEKSEADKELLVGAGSTAAPTQESPATPATSSEAASENSEATQQAPVTPVVQYYTVENGDTLYGIARRFYGAGKHWKAVYNANRDLIKDSRELKLGWRLELPPIETVVNEN